MNHEYRIGYEEGYFSGIKDLLELMVREGKTPREAYQICLKHRKQLIKWTLQEPGGSLEPPRLEMDSRRSKGSAVEKSSER